MFIKMNNLHLIVSRDSSYCELVWESSDCEHSKCMSVVRGAICRQLKKMLIARMSRTLFIPHQTSDIEMPDVEMLLLIWNFSQETIIFIIFRRKFSDVWA